MFKNLTQAQLEVLATTRLQWHLCRLYEAWDEFQKIWKNVNNETMQVFLHFPEGTPTQVIHDWFASVNPRFNVNDVMGGIRLKPITSRADRIPVYDRNGLQVCLGDKLKAQKCTGRYGRVAQVDAVADEEHTRLGAVNVVHNGSGATIFFNAHLISGFDIGYKDFVDFEHGHETWIEIVSA